MAGPLGRQRFVALRQIAVIVGFLGGVGEIHVGDRRRDVHRQPGGNRVALEVGRRKDRHAGNGPVGGRESQGAFRRGAGHDVLVVAIAVGQPGKGVVAVGGGGGRADLRGFAGLDHAVAVVVPEVQRDGHAGIGRFARARAGRIQAVHQAVVGRRVEPDRPAQAVVAGVAVAEIDVQVAARAGIAPDGGHLAAGHHDVRRVVVERAVRRPRVGQALGEINVVGRHFYAVVGEVHQAAEPVEAVGIGGVGGDGHPVGVQDHVDVRNAELAGVAHAVVVRIDPYRVADDAPRRVAEVRAHVDLRGRERPAALVVAGHDVERIVAGQSVRLRVGGLVRARQGPARGFDHDDVVRRQQSGEHVEPGRVGRFGGHERFAPVVQAVAVGIGIEADRDTRHAGIVEILIAVAAQIPEDRVADRAVGREAEIRVQIDVAAADLHVERNGRARVVDVAVGVDRQIGVGVVHFDAVGAVGQRIEQVLAVGVGVRGLQEHVDAVAVEVGVEADRDVGQAGLLRAELDAVGVAVEPDRVADRAAADGLEAEILVEIVGVDDRHHAAGVQRAPRIRGDAIVGRQVRIGAVHHHQVGVRREQVREDVVAVRRRGRRRDARVGGRVHDAVAVGVFVEPDRDVRDAFLGNRILRAVAVPVVEQRVADAVGPGAEVAEIRPPHPAERDRHRGIVRRVGAVRIPRYLPGAVAEHAGIRRDVDGVGAVEVAGESEIAVGGRDVRGDGRARAARRRAGAQIDRHVGHPVLAGFAIGFLAAVVVVPDRAFDRAGQGVAEIGRQVQVVRAVGVDVQVDGRRAVVGTAFIVGVHAGPARQGRRHHAHRVDARRGD